MSRQAALNTLAALFASAALLAGCGSDDDNPPPPPPPPPPPAASAATVSGTAAVGAALSGANVSITDASGTSVCSESTIVTSGIGAYACTLIAGKTAPFIVVVTDPSGGHSPLVSIATETPPAASKLVVNATPLTTAIVAQLSSDRSALSVAANPSLIDADKLASVKGKVLTQLADVLAALGAPSGYDPFSTPITAATASASGNTADQIIDLLRISTVNGVPTVSTVDNPSAAVALADDTTATPPKLSTPSTSALKLADALKQLTATLQQCFAQTSAQRVTSRDTSVALNLGGPRVTGFGGACANILDAAYLSNGYDRGQALYGLLVDDAMTGATFSLPEVTWFIDDATPADNDRAIVNIRYVDKNGVAGNFFSVARKGTAGWTLYGNQQPVDTVVRSYVRRAEQMAPNPGQPGPFLNAAASRYETGIELYINKDGPNSANMRAARVKGPGLPSAGVVLTPLDTSICSSQTWMNIRRKDGNVDPGFATPSGNESNIFRLQRTVGLTGTDATTLRGNPNAGNSNNTAFVSWAHPLDYGAQPGATDYIDMASLKPNSVYTIEVYYLNEPAPRYTVTRTMATAVPPATTGNALQWRLFDETTLGYVKAAPPLNAATATMSLAWSANALAEPIRSVGVYTFSGSDSANQGITVVPKGTNAVQVKAPTTAACGSGTQFLALTSDGTSGRQLQLRYAPTDGSYKDSTARYN